MKAVDPALAEFSGRLPKVAPRDWQQTGLP